MIILNKAKFIEINGNYLSFYDGQRKEIQLYDSSIWAQILRWYENPREFYELPEIPLSNNEVEAIRDALIALDILTNYKIIPRQTIRISNFYATYGAEKSQRIKDTKILIWGCGTVGSAVFEALVKMGFKKFFLVDPDVVEEKNIIAQSIFTKKDINKSKTEVITNYSESLGLENLDIHYKRLFIQSINQLREIHLQYPSDILIDCADKKDRELDLQTIEFAESYKNLYISTGYANDKDYIFKVSNDFRDFKKYISKNWEKFGNNIRFSTNRGTIVDSHLLGSLVARSVINHILNLDKKDKIIMINLLEISMRTINFYEEVSNEKE